MAKIKYIEANGQTKVTNFDVLKITMQDENGSLVSFLPAIEYELITKDANFYEDGLIVDLIITSSDPLIPMSLVIVKPNFTADQVMYGETVCKVPGTATQFEDGTEGKYAIIASKVHKGYVGWVNGERVDGEYEEGTPVPEKKIEKNKYYTITSAKELYVLPTPGYDGMAKVTINNFESLIDGTLIKSKATILGVKGSYTNTHFAPTSAEILRGKEAWANGDKIPGGMIDKRGVEISDGIWKTLPGDPDSNYNTIKFIIPISEDATKTYCINNSTFIKSGLRQCLKELSENGQELSNLGGPIRKSPHSNGSEVTYYYTGRTANKQTSGTWKEVIAYGWQYVYN